MRKQIRESGPFPCPSCKGLLQASEYYPLLTLLTSLLFLIGVFAALGFRGIRLFYAMLWAFVPDVYLAANFFKYIFPPKIETYLPDMSLRLRD
jgi:hypothetical protein